MKKLVLIAAVAIASMASYASAFKWSNPPTGGNSVLYISGSTTDKVAGGTAMYLFDADVITQKAVLSAFFAGTDVSTLTKVTSTTINGTTGKATTKDFTYGTTSNYYDYFFAVVNGKEVYVSSIKADQLAQESATTTFSWTDVKTSSQLAAMEYKDSFASAGWYTSGTGAPEPTSGVLLMLGMGLMALRRRRA